MRLHFVQDNHNPLLFNCANPLGPNADEERRRIFQQMPVRSSKSERWCALDELFACAAYRRLLTSEQGEWLQSYKGSWQYETMTLMENCDHAHLRFNDAGIAALFKLSWL